MARCIVGFFVVSKFGGNSFFLYRRDASFSCVTTNAYNNRRHSHALIPTLHYTEPNIQTRNTPTLIATLQTYHCHALVCSMQ